MVIKSTSRVGASVIKPSDKISIPTMMIKPADNYRGLVRRNEQSCCCQRLRVTVILVGRTKTTHAELSAELDLR